MYTGFPVRLLALVRCCADGRELTTLAVQRGGDASIEDGTVRCAGCGCEYAIRRGILDLVEAAKLDTESAHELRLRDEQSRDGDYVDAFRATWRLRQVDRMEMIPTLAATEPLGDQVALDVGCGTGRYTVELAKRCRTTVALDFSAGALAVLARKLDDSGSIAVVRADVTRFVPAPGAFTRVISMLYSNLPTEHHRDSMCRVAADALHDAGAFVFSAHHYSLRERARSAPRDGRYTDGGIYRRLFTKREIDRQLSRYFSEVSTRPIQIMLPLTYRIGLPLVSVSRLAELLPGIRELGHLLLVTARRPIARSTA